MASCRTLPDDRTEVKELDFTSVLKPLKTFCESHFTDLRESHLNDRIRADSTDNTDGSDHTINSAHINNHAYINISVLAQNSAHIDNSVDVDNDATMAVSGHHQTNRCE